MSTTNLRKAYRQQASLAQIQARIAQLPQTKTTDSDVRIDAEAARELLAINTHNRRLNRKSIERFAGLMTRGAWKVNGDNIRVSVTGKLLDGQNRLTAVLEAAQEDPDVVVVYDIVWGLEDEAQETMDVGAKRSLAQAFQLRGESNATQLAATTKIVWQIENGGIPARWLAEPSYGEYIDFVASNQDLKDAVLVGVSVAKSVGIPASCAAAAYFEASKIDEQDADDFFTDLADLAAQVKPDSPMVGLRKLAAKRVARGGMSRIEQASAYDICVRAFQDYRDGRSTPTSGYRLTRRPRVWRIPN